MASPTDHPRALPHDPPLEILPDVFFVHGSFKMAPGIVINRNMVVVRDGTDLTLLNPIRLDHAGEKALDQLGTVRHVMRLGYHHGVDDPYVVARFGAQFWSQADSTLHPRPRPDEILSEERSLPMGGARLFVFRGTNFPECAVLLERAGGTLISCDALQHWESTSRCSLPARIVTRLLGFMHPANIGPPWLRMMTPKGGSLRPEFERLLEHRFENLIGAHGQPLIGGAHDALVATVERVFGEG